MNQVLTNQLTVQDDLSPAAITPTLPEGIGYYRRSASYAMDMGFYYATLVGVVSVIAMFFDSAVLRIDAASLRPYSPALTLVVELVLYIGYFALFESLFGATPGKLILGICVVQVDGRPCTFTKALIRGVMRLVDGLFFGVVAAFNMQAPRRQRWGDKRARTMVVSAKDPNISVRRSWRRFAVAWLAAGTLMTVCCLLFIALDVP